MDYDKLGFKAGLEIHQQLDTRKLFCNCESVLRKDEPDFEVSRKLHAIAGEGGEIDVAAKHEAGLSKDFIYQGYDSTCLVELDEEPPHKINSEALKIALHISLLLNCSIVPVTQIMRKTVINGSNTSGFQRTLMVARDGYLETSNGKVGIDYVYLEEDAARTVEERDGKKVYRLDRLGIPLVEIVTAPDVKTPEQAKDIALRIGDLLRSCKVKRGLGTIRQDINISIKGHPRAEIKGFQDPKVFVDVVEKEIQRQQSDLKNKKELKDEVRGALPDNSTKFLRPLPGSARMYPETDLPILKISRDFINQAKKSLPKLRSAIEEELVKDGLSQEMIKLLFKQNKLEEFKELFEIVNNPGLIAKVLLMFPKEIASHENISISKANKILNKDVLAHVLENLRKKKISESQIKHVLERIVRGESLEEAVKFEKHDVNVIEEKIHKIIRQKPSLSEKAYMGLVMKEFKGKVSGKDAMSIIMKYMK